MRSIWDAQERLGYGRDDLLAHTDARGVQATESHVPMVQLIRISCSYVTVYAAAPMGLP